MQFLTFQMFAPMAATGQPQNCGEVRACANIPRTSQLIGLFGCCLGIGHDRRDELAAMADNLGLCVMALNPLPWKTLDFHIVQAPAEGKDLSPCLTRADELAAFDRQQRHRPPTTRPNAILSRREYLNDSPYVVTAWSTGEAAPAMETLAQAMRRPHWTPFFGRKSCPFALPLAPHITDHDTPMDALRAYPLDPALLRLRGTKIDYWMREDLFSTWRVQPGSTHNDVLRGHTGVAGHGKAYRDENWRRIHVA